MTGRRGSGRSSRLPVVTAAVLLLLAVGCAPRAAHAQGSGSGGGGGGGGAFLGAELPLQLLAATPSELLSPAGDNGNGTVTLRGRQAITAVFSRAVIALGSDWGAAAPPAELVRVRYSVRLAVGWWGAVLSTSGSGNNGVVVGRQERTLSEQLELLSRTTATV